MLAFMITFMFVLLQLNLLVTDSLFKSSDKVDLEERSRPSQSFFFCRQKQVFPSSCSNR